MTDKEYSYWKAVFERNMEKAKTMTKEEATKELIRSGALDEEGNIPRHYPELREWVMKNKKE